jgi:hypothetical protein
MTADDIVQAAVEVPADQRVVLLRAIAASFSSPSVPVGSSMAETEVMRHLEVVDKTIRALPPGDQIEPPREFRRPV